MPLCPRLRPESDCISGSGSGSGSESMPGSGSTTFIIINCAQIYAASGQPDPERDAVRTVSYLCRLSRLGETEETEESHAHCNRIYNTITPASQPASQSCHHAPKVRTKVSHSKWSKMFGATGSCTRTILGAIFSQASRSQQIATFIQQDEWRLTIYMCAHNSGGQAEHGVQGSPHNGLKLKTVIATRYRVHKQLPLVSGRGRERAT